MKPWSAIVSNGDAIIPMPIPSAPCTAAPTSTSAMHAMASQIGSPAITVQRSPRRFGGAVAGSIGQWCFG